MKVKIKRTCVIINNPFVANNSARLARPVFNRGKGLRVHPYGRGGYSSQFAEPSQNYNNFPMRGSRARGNIRARGNFRGRQAQAPPYHR